MRSKIALIASLPSLSSSFTNKQCAGIHDDFPCKINSPFLTIFIPLSFFRLQSFANKMYRQPFPRSFSPPPKCASSSSNVKPLSLNSLTRTPTSFTFIAFTLANLLIGSSFTIFLTFSGNLLSTNSNAVCAFAFFNLRANWFFNSPVLLTINFSADVNVVVVTSLCFFFFFCSSSSMPGGNGGGLMLFPGESSNSYSNTYANDALIFVDFSPPGGSSFFSSSFSSSSSSSSCSSSSSIKSSSKTTLFVIFTSSMSSFKSGRTFTVSQTIACVADGKSILFSSSVNRFMDWPCFFSRADLRSLESTRAACNRHVRTCA